MTLDELISRLHRSETLRDDLDRLTIVQLIALARRLGLRVSRHGIKSYYVDELTSYLRR